MKIFLSILLAFVALVSVKCEPKLDMKALVDKVVKEYQNMSEHDIKIHTECNARALCAILRVQELSLRLQGLEYVAKENEEQAKLVESMLPEVWSLMDREDNPTQAIDYMRMGMTLAIDFAIHEHSAKQAVIASDSEENLHKKYSELRIEFMSAMKTVIEGANHFKGAEFWLKGVFDYHTKLFERFDNDLKSLKTTEIREKTLQFFINDMEVFLSMSDGQHSTPSPTTASHVFN